MNITFPEGTGQEFVKMVEAIGRNVLFVNQTYSGCSSCGLNTITNESIDSSCPVCSGIYWIPVQHLTTVKAHVLWKNSERATWESGGQYFKGDCKVKVPYTSGNYTLAMESDYIMVDGRKTSRVEVTLLGVPSLNRIIVHTKEEDGE